MGLSNALPPEFDRGTATNVHQGDCLVGGDPGLTYGTVLGSCVSACVRDRLAMVGGMNHFLLAEPTSAASDKFGASARYGAFAMEQLINRVLVLGSGNKANLEIKLFGGGLISTGLGDVGTKNVEFVRDFLKNEGYIAAGEDLGGTYARRVLFKPHSGRVFVKRLDGAIGVTVARAELSFAVRTAPKPSVASDDIELF